MTGATSTARQDEVREYAAAVRAALADVPADLLDDLEEHLAEVAADGEGSLASRLGPPADYARELRTAAGLPVGEEATAGARAGGAKLIGRLRSWGPMRQEQLRVGTRRSGRQWRAEMPPWRCFRRSG